MGVVRGLREVADCQHCGAHPVKRHQYWVEVKTTYQEPNKLDALSPTVRSWTQRQSGFLLCILLGVAVVEVSDWFESRIVCASLQKWHYITYTKHPCPALHLIASLTFDLKRRRGL